MHCVVISFFDQNTLSLYRLVCKRFFELSEIFQKSGNVQHFFKATPISYQASPALEGRPVCRVAIKANNVFVFVKLPDDDIWHLHRRNVQAESSFASEFKQEQMPDSILIRENDILFKGDRGTICQLEWRMALTKEYASKKRASLTTASNTQIALFNETRNTVQLYPASGESYEIFLRRSPSEVINITFLDEILVTSYNTQGRGVIEWFNQDGVFINELIFEEEIASVHPLETKLLVNLKVRTHILIDLIKKKTLLLAMDPSFLKVYEKGSDIVALYPNGIIVITSQISGQKKRTLRTSRDINPTSLQFWDKFVALTSYTNHIEIWNLESYTLVGKLPTSQVPLSLDFKEGKLACLLKTGAVILWDIKNV